MCAPYRARMGSVKAGAALPMSEATLELLRERAVALEALVDRLAPEATNDALEGMTHGPYFDAASRLAALRRVLAHAQVVRNAECALVGSRVSLADRSDLMEVELTAPDLADPAVGSISIESPLGAAVLGRRCGETVEFETPTGTRVVTLTAIA
jgi:transcription elongation GreA/GreB family factor